jgi:hypothetical protein
MKTHVCAISVGLRCCYENRRTTNLFLLLDPTEITFSWALAGLKRRILKVVAQDSTVRCGDATNNGRSPRLEDGYHYRRRRRALGSLTFAMKHGNAICACHALAEGKQPLEALRPLAAEGQVQQHHWRGVDCTSAAGLDCARVVHAWGRARRIHVVTRRCSTTGLDCARVVHAWGRAKRTHVATRSRSAAGAVQGSRAPPHVGERRMKLSMLGWMMRTRNMS